MVCVRSDLSDLNDLDDEIHDGRQAGPPNVAFDEAHGQRTGGFKATPTPGIK